jgi:hypothetical protein
MVVLLLLQVGVFFDLGLIEPVDDGVFPLGNQDLLDLRPFNEVILVRARVS